jgi:hypothetical protein
MNAHDFGPGDRPQKCKVHHKFDGRIHYLLHAEEQLFQPIPTFTSLAGVLNEICSALDCEIGNVVSFISLPGDDAGDLASMAMNAALFGLYTFCSEGIVAENNEPLGSLEMYCSVPRSPSASEFQLIERAKCLAAIAIKRDNGADHQGNCIGQGNRPVRGWLLEWPVLMN